MFSVIKMWYFSVLGLHSLYFFFSPRGICSNEIYVLLYHVLHFFEFHGGEGLKGLFKNKTNEQGANHTF